MMIIDLIAFYIVGCLKTAKPGGIFDLINLQDYGWPPRQIG